MSDPRRAANRGNISRLAQYQRARRKFAIKVYLIASIFILVTFANWAPCIFIPFLQELFYANYFIAIAFLFVALVMETALVVKDRLRFMFPLNWILTVLIVLCITWGLIWAVVRIPLYIIAISIVISIIVVVASIAAGFYVKRDLTLHMVILLVCCTVFFAGSVLFFMFFMFAYIQVAIFVYIGFIAATVVLFIMYHAQTIYGGRFAEMRLSDFLLAALLIYHDFIIILFLMLFSFTSIFGTGKSSTETMSAIGFRTSCALCDRNLTYITIP